MQLPLRLLAAVFVAVAALAAASLPDERRLEPPRVEDLRNAYRAGTDGSTVASLLPMQPAARSLRVSTPSGESVDIRVSTAYAFGETEVQAWADFLGSLLHGSELESVVVYFAPPSEISRTCGGDAAACYAPAQRTIVTPGEDLAPDLTAEAILAHEYGHHLANSRSNAPWSAVEYGTKRWATYAGICPGVRNGELSLSAATQQQYELNPGEGFAEAYRVANERHLGVVGSPWQIVSQRFYPDETAAGFIEQDVSQPWTSVSTVSYPGSFKRGRGDVRTFRVATPLDGTATAEVRAKANVSFKVSQAQTTVCGERTSVFTVRRVKGFGSFRLFVTRP